MSCSRSMVRRLTVPGARLTVSVMLAAAEGPRGRRTSVMPRSGRPLQSPPASGTRLLLGLLTLLLGVLLGRGEGLNASSEPARIGQPSGLLPTSAQVSAAEAPDLSEFETLAEEAEDPLLAFHHHLGVQSTVDVPLGAHGSVAHWTVCSPIFRSSSARGPPRSCSSAS